MSLDAHDLWCPCGGAVRAGKCERCGHEYFRDFTVSGLSYQAPECRFDFAAAIRDRIVEDVTLHGLTYRCLADTANAFHDWSDAQIDEWLTRNNILMRRHHDGGWLFRSRHTHDLSEFESAVRERAPQMVESYYQQLRDRIRAEVEAMDWPEVIGE